MSTTFIIEFRDGNTQDVAGHSLNVNDGTIQVVRENGTTIAAFPTAGVTGVIPVENPVPQNIVYTARDYAINHAIIPLIEERGLNPDGNVVNVDNVADDVLMNEGNGVRIGVDDEHFAESVRKWSTKG